MGIEWDFWFYMCINIDCYTSPSNLRGLEHITPQPMKMDFLPPELSKHDKSHPEAVLKNYSNHKKHKMENQIVLILSEYIYTMNI
jgi:hypothetical protein